LGVEAGIWISGMGTGAGILISGVGIAAAGGITGFGAGAVGIMSGTSIRFGFSPPSGRLRPIAASNSGGGALGGATVAGAVLGWGAVRTTGVSGLAGGFTV